MYITVTYLKQHFRSRSEMKEALVADKMVTRLSDRGPCVGTLNIACLEISIE